MEDMYINVYLEDYLPEDLSIYGENRYTTVFVDIEQLVIKDIEIKAEDIDLKNMPENLQFSFLDEVLIRLSFKGIPEDLESISLESLSPFIRLNGLEAGEHEVSLSYYVSYLIEDLTEPAAIKVLLTEIEAPAEDTEENNGEADNNG